MVISTDNRAGITWSHKQLEGLPREWHIIVHIKKMKNEKKNEMTGGYKDLEEKKRKIEIVKKSQNTFEFTFQIPAVSPNKIYFHLNPIA